MSPNHSYQIDPARLPAKLQPLAEEICAYFRELPRLLDEGKEGKSVLIHGSELVSVWDTLEDAMQAGADRFGLEKHMTQPIDSRDLAGLGEYFAVQPQRATA